MEKRYLLFSDTHGRNHGLANILKNRGPFDGVIFCGDGQGLENELRTLPGCPPVIHMVSGNCDFYSDLPEDAVFSLGSHRIFLTHGHKYFVSRNMDVISDYALKNNCDICFFGHIHKPFQEIVNGVLCVNPGSLSSPRQDPAIPTWMLIEETDGELTFSLQYLKLK